MGPTDGTTKTVSVLIVDDQIPFRAVARMVISLTSGFVVAAEAESGEDAVAVIRMKHLREESGIGHPFARRVPDKVFDLGNLPSRFRK